jgi:hypothetical protein
VEGLLRELEALRVAERRALYLEQEKIRYGSGGGRMRVCEWAL